MTTLKPGQISLAGIFLAIVLTSCSSPSPGEPVPTSGGPATTSQDAPTTTSAAVTLADMQPCNLLTAADLEKLGAIGAGEERQVGTARTCDVETENGSTGPGIRTNVGLDGVRNPEARDITVGTHQAKIGTNKDTGGCTVYLGVSESTRVDVVAVDLRGDEEKACDLARKTAELVEKNLPES